MSEEDKGSNSSLSKPPLTPFMSPLEVEFGFPSRPLHNGMEDTKHRHSFGRLHINNNVISFDNHFTGAGELAGAIQPGMNG